MYIAFGGGQVGYPLSRILLGCGKRVRIVKRSAGGLPDGVELARGDATDPNFCVEAAWGASTVYHCINPPYYARVWAELLPQLTMPRPVLKILALAVPFFREIDEMLYQWEEPFQINDWRFRERFGQGPRDVERAAAR
jgi:hypothetical protein